MGNKKKEEGYQTKTLKFKVRSHDMGELLDNAIDEYTNYYNSASKWICDNLDTKIVKVADNIDEKRRTSKYYLAANDQNWKDEPMWKIFTKKFTNDENFSEQAKKDKIVNDSNCANILKYSIVDKNNDNYTGNILNLTDTSYRLNGYIQNCISNYKTKIRSAKPKVRRTKITEDSTYEEKINNTIYEMVRNGFLYPKDFSSQIKYLSGKENTNEKLIERLTILKNFFQENTDAVSTAFSKLSVEMLKNNGGCTRNNIKKTLNISSIDYNIERKENCDGYILSFGSKNKRYNIDLWGRKDTIVNGKELVDISKHGESLTITSDNGTYYVCITVDMPFEKKSTGEIGKTAGIDINTKHTFLAGHVVDNGSIKGYCNIYKKLLQDKDFSSLIHKQELEEMKELSETVSFAPIEYDYLMSRIIGLGDYEKRVEDQLTKSLKLILAAEKDERNRMYVGSVIKMRALLKIYISTKQRYFSEQQTYDAKMNFIDTSTESKETMDKRRFENPFSKTEIGKKLNNELAETEKKIIGCRNNIVRYAYTTFQNNGYSFIEVEELESSTFSNTRLPFPSVKSLLNYHHLLGKTIEEAESVPAYSKFKNYYILSTDEEGKITDAKLSEKAILENKKTRTRDIIIKAIHFAEAKDIFCQMSNNGTVSVAFEPPFFSSQMDSKSHKVFTTKNKDGKDVIASKETVRPKQEKHINGMNCDINAAKNLDFMLNNEEFRNAFLLQTKNGYNEPFYKPAVKSPATMLAKLKKMGATTPISEEIPTFSKPKSKKKVENK